MGLGTRGAAGGVGGGGWLGVSEAVSVVKAMVEAVVVGWGCRWRRW